MPASTASTFVAAAALNTAPAAAHNTALNTAAALNAAVGAAALPSMGTSI